MIQQRVTSFVKKIPVLNRVILSLLIMGRVCIIRSSRFFNASWYVKNYPDIKKRQVSPAKHYLLFGALEGRNPGPDFDTKRYYQYYPHLRQKNINPLVHYAKTRMFYNKESGNRFKIDKFVFPTDRKVAVIIHAFYIDILEELLKKLHTIPVPFDLGVTVVNRRDMSTVERLIQDEGITQCKNRYIRYVENRGRDMAPFILAWRDIVERYDFICKLHTKKSLYTGNEKRSWREDLLSGLVGSRDIVEYNLHTLCHDNEVGVIYSDSMFHIPYWGYTRLSNKASLDTVQEKLGIHFDIDQYLDFPAGSMFWFRVKALQQLFISGITINDFPPEKGQIDGTLAHAIERSINYIARYNNFTFLEINYYQQSINRGRNNRNLYQYEGRQESNLLDEIDSAEIVSFDIFNTLLVRPYLYPSELYGVLERQIQKEFSVRFPFFQERQAAEAAARKKLGKDVNYDEIYDEMISRNPDDIVIVERLRELEFQYELDKLFPRTQVVNAFYRAAENKKRVLLITDMYLTREQIEAILRKNKINGYDHLYVSSEVNKRKDNGSLWELLIEKEQIKSKRYIHIGDDEHSDIQMTGIFGLKHFHVMSPVSLFQNSTLGRRFVEQHPEDWKMISFLGPYVNHFFNNPFRDFTGTCLNSEETGFSVFGPVLFAFTHWLYRQLVEKKIQRVYFFSREGYILKTVFDVYQDAIIKDDREKIISKYLLISRRAIIGTLDKSLAKLREIFLQNHFYGTVYDLFLARFGYDVKDRGKDKTVHLPLNIDTVLKIAEQELSGINRQAREEREAYLAYLKDTGFLDDKEAAVVDIGYSATSQRYLHELTGKKLSGFYFVTRKETKEWVTRNNDVKGFFASEVDKTNRVPVFLYSLIFEALMISGDGQLSRMKVQDGKTVPEFGTEFHDEDAQKNYEKLVRGIKDFFVCMAELEEDHRSIDPEDAQIPLQNAVDNDVWNEELKRYLYVEDNYCGNEKWDVLRRIQAIR